MRYLVFLTGSVLALACLIVACGDDDTDSTPQPSNTAGSGGEAGSGGSHNIAGFGGEAGSGGTHNAAGSSGEAGTGGTHNEAGSGGSGNPNDIQCPGDAPRCSDDGEAILSCQGPVPQIQTCKGHCENAECVCSSNEECAEGASFHATCQCVDGQNVTKTGAELARCDNRKCLEFTQENLCQEVCIDNGGSGTLIGFGTD